tara:strand:- start:1214 stop:2167 length:954 start_codon:yes stop_codon:yes gene_type:complete
MLKHLKSKLAEKRLRESVASSRNSFGSKLAAIFSRSAISNQEWEQIEELLLQGDTGPQFAFEIVDQLQNKVDKLGINDATAMLEELRAELISSLEVSQDSSPITELPCVIMVVGVNGSGKTTTLAKLAHSLASNGKVVMLAAGDTFRAGAIEQIQYWGNQLSVRVIAHQQGSDPGAVAYDAATAAIAHKADFLIVDTAGRLHTNSNLMAELDKVSRVLNRCIEGAPHEVLLVLDGMSGQNGLAQAEKFCNEIGTTGVILTKLDGSAKGGVAFGVVRQLKVPIKFVGTGEGIDDLATFDPIIFVDALLEHSRGQGKQN